MAAEAQVTSIITLAEEAGAGQRVTAQITLAEEVGQGQRVTEALVLAEYAALAAYATSMVVLVEMEAPRECRPQVRYVYNDIDITAYCNAADLKMSPKSLPKSDLGSTGQAYRPGLSENEVRLHGDWNPTIDALLGVDARRGAKRTGEMIFDDCTMAVRYTWEESVMVTEWKITGQARSKIEWSAVLRHNGAAARTVSAS